MSYGTILWDFDGTLAERPYTWSGSILHAFDELYPGHGVPLEQIRVHTAKNFPWHSPEKNYLEFRDPGRWWEKMEGVLRNTTLAFFPEVDASSAAKLARKHIVDATRYKLFPDVVPALSHLKGNGWSHAVLSNNYPDLETIVEALGIAPFFDEVFTSAKIGYEKPRKEIFEHVRSKILHRDRLWMIGDSESADAKGAEAAGIPAILVRQKGSSFSRQASNLGEVVKIIEDGLRAERL